MIGNWLKHVLGELISPNQASFIPGRQSVDNVIICQEILHTMSQKKGKKRARVIKLDLENAYDRME